MKDISKKKTYTEDPFLDADLSSLFELLQYLRWLLDSKTITFTSSATADAENTIAHTLEKVPTNFIKVNQNKASSVYKGTTAWTKDNIYLKVNVASTEVAVLIF